MLLSNSKESPAFSRGESQEDPPKKRLAACNRSQRSRLLGSGPNRQNSKSNENWIWRPPLPAMGCLNYGIGCKAEPNAGSISETFARLRKFKNSVTMSKRFTPPNGEYFRTRKSMLANKGEFREFLPRVSGLDESGKA